MTPPKSTAAPSRTDWGLLLLRCAGLALLLTAGWEKLTALLTAIHAGKPLATVGLAPLIGKMGFPVPALCALYVVMNESLGGILITCGLATRVAAACAALSMTGAFYTALHFGWEPLRAFLFLAIFATIAVTGAGRFSLDSLLIRWQPVGTSLDTGLLMLRVTILTFLGLLFSLKKVNAAASFPGGHAAIWLTIAAIFALPTILGWFTRQAATISALLWAWGAMSALRGGQSWDIFPYRDGMVVVLFLVLVITGPGRYSLRHKAELI